MDLMRQAKELDTFTPSTQAKLAKSLGSGGVVCILCKEKAVSNDLWIAHCGSNKHRQALLELKKKREPPTKGLEPTDIKRAKVENVAPPMEHKILDTLESESVIEEDLIKEWLDLEDILSHNEILDHVENTSRLILHRIDEIEYNESIENEIIEGEDYSEYFTESISEKKSTLNNVINEIINQDESNIQDTNTNFSNECSDDDFDLDNGWRRKKI